MDSEVKDLGAMFALSKEQIEHFYQVCADDKLSLALTKMFDSIAEANHDSIENDLAIVVSPFTYSILRRPILEAMILQLAKVIEEY